MSDTPDAALLRARSLAAGGDLAAARGVLDAAARAHPAHAPLANSAGSLAMRAGDALAAEAHFARAVGLDRSSYEFAVNHAIALSALGRNHAALGALGQFEQQGRADPRYCSARANAHRGAGQVAAASAWYDLCLALQPAHARALHGRARVALERGETDAVARYEASLAVNRVDAEAWLGLAEALDAAGESARAREIAEQLVAQGPHWIAALRFLAQLRLATGEADFASHFAAGIRQRPTDPALARAHVAVLEQHDLFDEALAAAQAAHARMPEADDMALLVAVQAGVAGDDEAAAAIFARLKLDTPERWLQEARHRLHLTQFDRAADLLDRLLEIDPDHISGWALRDILWRLSGDPRSDWLHKQDGLVQLVALGELDDLLAEVVPVLHELHDRSSFPLGQSLRGGTQTRGILYDRTEPALARLHAAQAEALECYRAALPPADPAHPLLRYRDAPWAITGSWSVRLAAGGDHHAAHLHPQGLLSSASYMVLPPDLGGGGDEMAGWIELGRPAPDLRIDLPPLYAVQPKLGHLALFPSTLYHGTRPFVDGQRMTVAIDVTLAEGVRNGEGDPR